MPTADIPLAAFLLTCLLRGMTRLADIFLDAVKVSTHMPLARHDIYVEVKAAVCGVSTHMPLARHDYSADALTVDEYSFYSHASCEA